MNPILLGPECAVRSPSLPLASAAVRGKGAEFSARSRLAFALVLVALEFTNFVQFLTFLAALNPRTSQFAIHLSPYLLQFLGYLICLLAIVLEPQSSKAIVRKPLFKWAFMAVILFTWGMLLRTIETPAGIQTYHFARPFALRINALLFVVSCAMLFEGPDILRFVKRAIVGATLLAVGLNLYELMDPGSLTSTIAGRAAGLYGNSNESGMAIVFGCLIGLTAIPRRWREGFVWVSALGITATFSREAMIAFLIVLVAAILGKALSFTRMAVSGVLVVALLLLAGAVAVISDNGVLSGDNLSRLSFHVSDSSASDRLRLAERAFDEFAGAPLLGNGFGTTHYWSDNESHNLYLSFMADHGIFGVLIIPALVLCLFRRSWDYYAFAAVFLFWCFLDHNLFQDPYALIILAIQATEPRVIKRILPHRAGQLNYALSPG
jgi:O-Antigen ligase